MAEKIYIDQGHNPTNPNSGAEGNGLREQDLVYEIGVRTAEILRAAGFQTRLSRPTPSTQLGTSVATSLAARVNDANSWGADWFLSLHANASSVTTASGSEYFVYSEASPAYVLAENVSFQVNAATGLRERGVKPRPSLYVLRRTAMPAVLAELGFITNPYDAELMRSSPESFAAGLANGFFAYLGLL